MNIPFFGNRPPQAGAQQVAVQPPTPMVVTAQVAPPWQPGQQVAPGVPMNAPNPMGQVPRGLGGRRLSGAAVASAQMAGTRLPFFVDGEYDRVEIVSTGMARTKYCFVVECKILQSNNPQRPEGSGAVWVQNCADENIAFPTIKRFAICLLGASDESQVPPDLLSAFIDALSAGDQQVNDFPANPAKGVILPLSVRTVPTKRGGQFTRHDWFPAIQEG